MKLTSALILPVWLAASLAGAAPADYFSTGARGWFWYEDPPPDPPERAEPPEPQASAADQAESPPGPDPGPAPGSVAWLRLALPAALDLATDAPTPENVERYFLLQQQALLKSERFAEVAANVTTGHPVLDEGRRRPRGDRFARLQDARARSTEAAVLADLFARAGLILFLDRACSECALLAQNLARMETLHGLAWRLVSLDGTVLPPEFAAPLVFDDGLAERLGVTRGGALVLATPPDRYDPVSWSATAGTEIIGRILRVAWRAGLITEAQYRATLPVHPAETAARTLAMSPPAASSLPEILRAADGLLQDPGLRLHKDRP